MINKKGKFEAIAYIPANILNTEIYSVGVALSTFAPLTVHFFAQDVVSFEVLENLNNRQIDYLQNMPGVVRPTLEWQHKFI